MKYYGRVNSQTRAEYLRVIKYWRDLQAVLLDPLDIKYAEDMQEMHEKFLSTF